MANLKHHPNFWLRDDAASAFNRAEDEKGVIGVNSAGRTVAEQNHLIALWHRGGAANRPPFLYEPAQPAESSFHVKNGGIAVDTSDWRRFATYCTQYGFTHPYPGGDPVHFEFRGGVSGAGSAVGSTGYANNSREMKIFQEKLLRMKHDLGPTGADGVLGPKTRLATMHEQSMAPRNGYPGGYLVIDGIPGPAINGYLDWWLTGPGKPAPQFVNTSKLTVSTIQRALNKLGYNLVVDNIQGHNTTIAVMDFQKKQGLVPDGIVGPATRQKLGI